MEDKAAEIAAATAAALEAAGKKVCLRARCAEWIDVDATKCPWCGARQGAVAAGITSGANRRSAHGGAIKLRFPGR